jgi:hypothetical protein
VVLDGAGGSTLPQLATRTRQDTTGVRVCCLGFERLDLDQQHVRALDVWEQVRVSACVVVVCVCLRGGRGKEQEVCDGAGSSTVPQLATWTGQNTTGVTYSTSKYFSFVPSGFWLRWSCCLPCCAVFVKQKLAETVVFRSVHVVAQGWGTETCSI